MSTRLPCQGRSADSATATKWDRRSVYVVCRRTTDHEQPMVCPTILVLAICIASLTMSGCGDLLSLHALFTTRDQVLDPAIEVRWQNDSDLLVLERATSGYLLTLKSKKD